MFPDVPSALPAWAAAEEFVLVRVVGITRSTISAATDVLVPGKQDACGGS